MPHTPTHAVVWLDYREAKVFLITAEDVERQHVKTHTPHRQVHHKASEVGSGHVRDDRKFFDAILAAIRASNGRCAARREAGGEGRYIPFIT